MNTIAWISGIVLAAMFSMAAMVKLTDHQMAVEMRTRFKIPKAQYQLIGVAEVAGAIGLIVGLARNDETFEWLGPLAALGLIALTAGAVYHHRKAGDEPKEAAPAMVTAMLCVVYFITVIAR